MTWWWDWHQTKFITKIKQGIVFYVKPNKTNYVKEIKRNDINKRLETKRVRTHMRK